MSRKGAVSAALMIAVMSGLAAAPSGDAAAQSYPGRSIRMIVGVAPGGSGDIMARIAASMLGQRLGVPVAVENKAGGAYIIANESVVRSAPDGYTLLHTSIGGLDILPSPEKLPYNPERDLIPIAMLATADSVMAVPSRLNIGTLAEFIARARAAPGQLTFASTGPGSVNHFAGELLRLKTGIEILHIPYKGSAAAMNDAIAGRVDVVFGGTVSVAPHMKSGAMRALAIMGRKRSPLMPEVPSMTELGYPDVLAGSWYGVFAPAGTPSEIVRRLARELGEMASSSQYAEQIGKVGTEVRVELLDQFARSIASERRLWQSVAKEANIRFE